MERIKFYDEVRNGIQRYLPAGYREYQVWIEEKEILGNKKAMFCIYKEGISTMPHLDMEEYLKRVQDGEKLQGVLIDMAVDYARVLSKCRAECCERSTQQIR